MKNLIYFLFVLLLSIGCKKDIAPISTTNPDNEETTNKHEAFKSHFGEAVTRDFIGIIVDVDHQPVENVTIRIGNLSTQTDHNGLFVIKKAPVNKYFSYITAHKEGYLHGSRAIAPTSDVNEIKIMLLPKVVTQTIQSGSTSVITTNGMKITFDGQFKTSSNTQYNGTVQVLSHQLNTDDNNFLDKMPGMLFARTEDGESRVLESYGMINIELLGSNGEKLQPVNAARIEFPIATHQLATAPSTMPLWHFNDSLGYWIEEGVATREGSKYVGEFSHFSWWNFDIPYEWVLLKIKIVDQNGNPLSNIRTSISLGGSLNTNSNGMSSGMVPRNLSLTLNIYALGDCNTILSTQNIGPLSVDTTHPDIVINTNTLQNISYKTVFGTLKDCNESNVSNGYVLLKQGNFSQTVFVSNGTFEFNILKCHSSLLTIVGENLDNGFNTGIHYINNATTTHDVGLFKTCQEESEGITITFEDTAEIRHVNTNLNATITGNSIFITGGTYDSFMLTGNSTTMGTHTTASGFELAGDVLTVAGHGGGASILSNFDITYHVINIGSPGEFIDIAFTGSYEENVQDFFDEITQTPISSNFSRNITGLIHIRRN